jgi:hypothetical protein
LIGALSGTTSPGDLSFLHRAERTLWTGEGIALGRVLAFGALIWAAYAVLVVLVHGVVLDQDLVPAQVIAGSVHYAPGHPHAIFYPRVFNLPTYLLAGLWTLWPNLVLLSGLRNIAFLFLSAFVPFAIASVLTRRPGCGFIAAAFTLSETAREVHGVYPMTVYPDFNSDGHMGAHVALLIVALLLGGFWRWGGLFLGLLPAIHPTMAVIIWPWSLCYLFFELRGTSSGNGRRLLLWAGVGIAACVALACLIWLTAPKTDTPAPYDSHVNGTEIYQRFEATTDAHRRPLPLGLPGYSVHPVALFALVGLLAWRLEAEASRRLARWLLVLGFFIWAYVLCGTVFFHAATGWLSRAVQISMPGRFSNLSALLLIPVSVALIARARQSSAIFTVLLVIQALFIPLDHELLRVSLIFVIWGAAFVADLYLRWQDRASGSRIIPLLAPATVAASSVVLYFANGEKGIIWLCLGFLIGTSLSVLRRAALPSWCEPVALLVALLVCLGLPMNTNPAYHLDAYDRQLNSWLAMHASPDEPILPPFGPPSELQAKSGHPVLMEEETLYLMTYMPALAPVLGTMARDLYGIDYTDPSKLAPMLQKGRILPGSGPVLAVWRSKKANEWRRLGERYHFRLVLSPTTVQLDLSAVLPGPRWTLYSIE